MNTNSIKKVATLASMLLLPSMASSYSIAGCSGVYSYNGGSSFIAQESLEGAIDGAKAIAREAYSVHMGPASAPHGSLMPYDRQTLKVRYSGVADAAQEDFVTCK